MAAKRGVSHNLVVDEWARIRPDSSPMFYHIEKTNPRAIRSAMALNLSDFEQYQHRHVSRLIQMGGNLAIVKANDGSVEIVQGYTSPDSDLSVNLDGCLATDLRPRHLRPDSLAFVAYCT